MMRRRDIVIALVRNRVHFLMVSYHERVHYTYDARFSLVSGMRNQQVHRVGGALQSTNSSAAVTDANGNV